MPVMDRSGFLRNIHVGIAREYMYVSEPLVNYIFFTQSNRE